MVKSKNSKTRTRKKTKKKKRGKISLKKVVSFLLLSYALYTGVGLLVNVPIRNIYVLNNSFVNDQHVIEVAKLEDYPSFVKNTRRSIRNRLLDDQYIKDVSIRKKTWFEVHIDVVENSPILYYDGKTYFQDSSSVNRKYNVPSLINFAPSDVFNLFIEELALIDENILNRISEIQYDPNDADNTRFLLMMNDKNYVYINVDSTDMLDEYINIIKNFDNKRGILYLDSGEFFQVLQD